MHKETVNNSPPWFEPNELKYRYKSDLRVQFYGMAFSDCSNLDQSVKIMHFKTDHIFSTALPAKIEDCNQNKHSFI